MENADIQRFTPQCERLGVPEEGESAFLLVCDFSLEAKQVPMEICAQ